MIFTIKVYVTEWPPFGQKLLIRLNIYSLVIYICSYDCFPGFEDGNSVMIAPVPGYCFLLFIIKSLFRSSAYVDFLI